MTEKRGGSDVGKKINLIPISLIKFERLPEILKIIEWSPFENSYFL